MFFAIFNKKRGFVFRVWAPKAVKVSVVGDFNGWNPEANFMHKLIDGETFELFIPNLKQFDSYKYCIYTQDGRKLFKADPYAFHSETPKISSSNASKLYDLSGYQWSDKEYLDRQKHSNIYTSPVNIYEVNLLSWKRREDGAFMTYEEIAAELQELAAILEKRIAPMGLVSDGMVPRTRFFHYVHCAPDTPDIQAMVAAATEATGKAPIVCGSCLSDLSVISKYGSSEAFAFGMGRDFSLPGGAHQPNEFITCEALLKFAKVLAAYIVKTLG